ncbi:MAG TPA: molybdopterin molybdenumtransferase MoeA, partial [Anaerolineae bacterium]|nr:molybdopterin molybdenumtransferase MoeA [Anaerolineae bacterium]
NSADALGRILAQPITAPFQLPSFPRSTVDGFAVRAKDTYGASESLPAYLKLVGEVRMGTASDIVLGKGECAIMHTGGMLPQGADAVVMVEYTQQPLPHETEIWRAVGAGENVLQAGEDVAEGELVIAAGTRVRSAEIGGIMALGLTEVTVARRPRVGILSSGDEVIPPGQPLQHGQVYDINSYTLRALIEQAGGIPHAYGIIPDNASAFAEYAQRALAENDLVVFTAGSSVSVRDLTATTIDALGKPGVLVHGVNVRPGKPTILAMCDGKPVIGLPGNPVSALVIAGLFVTPVIGKLLGRSEGRLQATVSATLTTNLNSQSGREDWVSVRLIKGEKGVVSAEPVFGKSGLIFTLTRADGLLRIHPDANGIAAGSQVIVHLL